MKYIKRISETPSFSQKGMDGYSLNDVNNHIDGKENDLY